MESGERDARISVGADDAEGASDAIATEAVLMNYGEVGASAGAFPEVLNDAVLAPAAPR